MKTLVYSAREFEVPYLEAANARQHMMHYIANSINERSAIRAKGSDAISIFSADKADSIVLNKLHQYGVKYVSLRSTGYDNIDLEAAMKLNIKVANVPAYSPYAIAEHAVALLLVLNRKIIKAHTRIKNYNFNLNSLVGFDLNKKKVGIIGTGTIGSKFAKIMHGFGCTLLGYDIKENKILSENFGLKYVGLRELCQESDIISLHTPLNDSTYHLLDKKMMAQMKPDVILINTARGAIIDTEALIESLQNGIIGAFGMDVYEFERGLFFKDHSASSIKDSKFIALNGMENVIITGHQAFLTHEALTNIAETTIQNLNCWNTGIPCKNELA